MSTVSHERPWWLEQMKRLARRRGGKCLSTEYTNNHTRLHWRCRLGHEWEAIPNSVAPRDGFKGSWCPTCAGRLPKEDMLKACQELAKDRGGTLLSKRYVDARTHLRWRCAKGHEWLSIPDNVKRGSWCAVCSGRCRLTLTQMRAYARELGGKCMSKAYINNETPLLWRCAEGHEWKAKPGHILQGHWCPICSTGVSERICRALLESITSVGFPKARPKWLRNGRGNQMELDGYAPSLRVAFEYQGHQHYRYVSRFQSSRAVLTRRRNDDLLKRRLCRKHGVRLLVVTHRVAHEKLQEYLGKQLKRLRAGMVVNMKPLEVRRLEVWRRKETSMMIAIAEAHRGKLLSRSYVNDGTKLRWRCAEGHTWETTPNIIKHGGWCGVCGRRRAALKRRAHTIDEMRALAKELRGVCLSAAYLGVDRKLRWRCRLGHEWKTLPMVVLNGHWCPKCARRLVGDKLRLTMQDIQNTAAERGGACLSKKYVDAHQKLVWRCSSGHRWRANANMVRRGTWCPTCARNHQLALG